MCDGARYSSIQLGRGPHVDSPSPRRIPVERPARDALKIAGLWRGNGKVPQGRQREELFRPCGTEKVAIRGPSDKSLGYFRSSFRTQNTYTRRPGRGVSKHILPPREETEKPTNNFGTPGVARGLCGPAAFIGRNSPAPSETHNPSSAPGWRGRG